jgi:hypothetical protein
MDRGDTHPITVHVDGNNSERSFLLLLRKRIFALDCLLKRTEVSIFLRARCDPIQVEATIHWY